MCTKDNLNHGKLHINMSLFTFNSKLKLHHSKIVKAAPDMEINNFLPPLTLRGCSGKESPWQELVIKPQMEPFFGEDLLDIAKAKITPHQRLSCCTWQWEGEEKENGATKMSVWEKRGEGWKKENPGSGGNFGFVFVFCRFRKDDSARGVSGYRFKTKHHW